jgi:putative transposase
MSIPTRMICAFWGKSRQSLYKHKTKALSDFVDEQQILSAVKNIRREQPRVGGRKLWLDLKDQGFDIGRDRFFNILKKNELLVKPRKRYSRTTDSNHWFRKYTNLVKGVQFTGKEQLYVADITYLRLTNGFAYLSLITDAWSHKIVGWDVSTSLSVEGALRALKMALKSTAHPEGLIHHSDRGVQYCCQDYTRLLKDYGVLISMTEENHCYENAIAERVNGILKDEFYLGDTLPSLKVAKELVKNTVRIYNTKRRHMSIDFKVPEEVHAIL